MKQAIVKINPSDYGLEEKKASQISGMFKPMLDKMVELEKEYNVVANLELSQETCLKAKELRLKYVKVRTGTADIHKDLKLFYLQGGRFVDGWKNAQLAASIGVEDKLKDIENHYENIEKERIIKLQEERQNKILKYLDEEAVMPTNLGEMADDVWNNYLTGTKINYKSRIEAERKAKAERIKKEKEEKAERERIRKENDQLKKEAEIAEAKRKSEEEARKVKEESERKKREAKELKERESYETKLKKEREDKERVEAELKAKMEEEEQKEKEEQANRQAELSKGDKSKVEDLISDFENIKTKYTFKSKKNQDMYSDVQGLLDKVIAYIKR